MGILIDLTGKRFGRLVVIQRAQNDKQRKPMWRCKCDCGNQIVVRGAALSQKHTVSCGCYCREIHTSHGSSETRLYHVWCSMKARCHNKNHTAYPDYGGRGITVCSEWLDFACFKKWAESTGYDESALQWIFTLDRIAVNAGYCPENCRWVGMAQQARNKWNNRILEYNGEKHTLSEWSNLSGVDGLEWPWLTAAQWSRILSILSRFFVYVTFIDPVSNSPKTIKMYCGDRSGEPYWVDDQGRPTHYCNCKVNLIDVGE